MAIDPTLKGGGGPARPPSVLKPKAKDLPPNPKLEAALKKTALRDLMRGKKSANIRVLVLVEDCSGSMYPWKATRSSFVPRFKEVVLTKYTSFSERLIVLYCAISGGCVTAGPVPIASLEQPQFQDGGGTPLATTFDTLTDLLSGWVEAEVIPAEAVMKEFEVVIFGDCEPSPGAEAERTPEAARKFAAFVKEGVNGRIKILGPAAARMDWAVVEALGVKREEVKYLDAANPDAILDWSIQSVDSNPHRSDPSIIAPKPT